jgi:hypothetical protein
MSNSSLARRLAFAAFSFALALGGAACTRTDTVQVGKPTGSESAFSIELDPARPMREQLVARRHAQIARLHAYAEAGVFPKNYGSPIPIHQLKDPQGNLCAVANLVHLDGHDDVIDAMSIDHNDVLIGEETSGPLHEWVLTSGLTAEEVANIQAPAPPMMNAQMEQQANLALQQHFADVEQQLVAGEAASLDLAVARLGGQDDAKAVAAK